MYLFPKPTSSVRLQINSVPHKPILPLFPTPWVCADSNKSFQSHKLKCFLESLHKNRCSNGKLIATRSSPSHEAPEGFSTSVVPGRILFRKQCSSSKLASDVW